MKGREPIESYKERALAHSLFGTRIPVIGNSSLSIGPDILDDSYGCSTDSHKAWYPIGQLKMVPFIISYVKCTDHGPCADLHVYKQTRIYETVPRLSTCDILLHCSASLYHCFTLHSFAFAQHCAVDHPPLLVSCTHLHPCRLYPSRVLPSDPVSLLQVRPLPPISSESQHLSDRAPRGLQVGEWD